MYKMLILVQIGSFANIDNLFNKILHYNNMDNLFIFSIMNELNIDIEKYNICRKVILYHNNVGMDIGPYLLQIKWMLNNLKYSQYDYIYKIHSKTDQLWFNELTNITTDNSFNDIYMSSKWSLALDSLNKYHINKFCDDNNLKNIYYDLHSLTIDYEDVDCDFYSSYYDVPLKDHNLILKTLNIDINLQYIIEHSILNDNVVNENQILVKRRKKIRFCGGSIFIIKYNLVYDFFKNLDIDNIYSTLEKGYSVNTSSTNVHALERIISSFFL